MAYNTYNQPAQSQSPRGRYQGPPHQNGWSDNAGQHYENGKQQQQGYPHGGYSQQAGDQYGYQNGQDQYGQETYHQAGRSPSQWAGQSYDQQQYHQQYQYDPRYRSQGEATNGQPDTRQDRGERRSREQHRPQQLDLNGKSKSRERILPAKESPIVVAWDNPFPMFNTKKKEGKKKHSSLDKEMSKISVEDQLQQRSQTSQSHRRGDESRPHTSQGHRKPEPQSHSGRLPSTYPMSPTERMPATRKDSARAMPTPGQFSDDQPPSHQMASGRAGTSMEGEPARLQKSQRSRTLPDEAAWGMGKKKGADGPAARSNRQRLDTRGGSQEPYTYVPAPISPVPVPTPIQHDGRAAAIPREPAQTTVVSPGMPNFDAISPSASERTEDPLHVATNQAKPAYQKVAYQAPTGAASLPRSQSQSEIAHTETTEADFAGFSFDLPAGSHNAPPFSQQPFQTDHQPLAGQAYGPASPPSNAQYQAPGYSRAEQHPPRAASRQGYQPPQSASSVERYESGKMPATQYGHASGALQYTDGKEYRSINRDPTYQYDQGAFGTQPGHPGEVAGGFGSRPPPHTPRPHQDARQYPAQINTRQDGYETMRQHASQTPQSAHATPSGPYQAANPSTPINPDTLPAHPVPVRPGLLEKSGGASRAIIEGTKIAYPSPPAKAGSMATTLREDRPMPITPYDLNLLSQTINNNPNDLDTTLTLAKKLVEAASVLSSEGGKADAKTTQKNRERYIFDAHKYLKKLVQRGHADAMFYLAECHGQGSLGLQVDPKEAFNLYMSAAKAGHGQAAYRVAVCCEMGHDEGGGTRRDPVKAVQWYKRAASMGDTPAMYKVGVILLKGLLGQDRNPREAKSWLQRAADQADRDNPHALHELGLMHEQPSGSDAMIVRDEQYSLQLFRQAAELGYKFSQFRLGAAFEYGLLGCGIQPRESIGWYTRAAAQGEHQAELALSGWYLTGAEGILAQSDTEAYLWARKAAGSGLAKAEYAMGYFTEVGIGCQGQLDEAKKWYWRAASQNFPQARQRLEDLKRGGGKMHKTRVSRSALNRQNQNEGECLVM